jgi:hypothetical protein
MSDYEWLVELAAKGMAERDNHPMPRSVTTPEAFYEVMARAALDAIVQELENADKGPKPAVSAEAVTAPPEEQSASPQRVLSVPPVTRIGPENGALPTAGRHGGTRKAVNARLRL